MVYSVVGDQETLGTDWVALTASLGPPVARVVWIVRPAVGRSDLIGTVKKLCLR